MHKMQGKLFLIKMFPWGPPVDTFEAVIEMMPNGISQSANFDNKYYRLKGPTV